MNMEGAFSHRRSIWRRELESSGYYFGIPDGIDDMLRCQYLLEELDRAEDLTDIPELPEPSREDD